MAQTSPRIGQVAINVDVRIMPATPQGSGAPGANSILYFHVPDHELWLSLPRDPDGNVVGLMEEKRPQPRRV